jgi:hypothetical protein
MNGDLVNEAQKLARLCNRPVYITRRDTLEGVIWRTRCLQQDGTLLVYPREQPHTRVAIDGTLTRLPLNHGGPRHEPA